MRKDWSTGIVDNIMKCSSSVGCCSPPNRLLWIALQIPAGPFVLGVLVMASPLKGAAMLPTALPGLHYVQGYALEAGSVDVGWDERGWRGWSEGRSRMVQGREIWPVQCRGGGYSESFLSNYLKALARLAWTTSRKHRRVAKIALKREHRSTYDLQGPHCSSSCR